ncbi:MAG TPA: YidC/Oxa1 family membrane protein insertase [Solirubrobacteraceae bacterium]|jgi:YidC/Oxa1 family membrane protein insertase|nr:YidC/Oxa1 family membrane protein insertase [Solirubrobacteraceae bacterium]
MPVIANIIEEAFSPLISVFEAIMVFIHDNIVGGSWGLAIIGLTVVVRAVMVPLTVSQFRSMQRMQALAPEIKKLQEKYKEDKQRQQQELMKFYQENKVNPFASCLPLVLQLPVFISLFYMLRSDLKLDICGQALREHFHVATNSAITSSAHLSSELQKITCNQVAPHSAKFLFIPDITAKATGAVLIVLLLLYIGSQVISTLMMSATADKNQRRMMLALPLVFVLFIFSFPAGLLVYWITTNLWTMGQQYFVRRGVGTPPAPADKQVAAKGSGSSPNGKAEGAPGKKAPKGEPALAGVGGTGSQSAPPPPPRKKKKRSGRRR